MATEEMVVLARFKARKGKEEEARRALLALLAPTREESGCRYYVCHGVQEAPDEFVFYEIWESRAALDEHLQKPYLQDLLKKAEGLFSEAPDIRYLDKLS